MRQPKDISLGRGWTVRFEDAENPVHIELKRGKTYGASLGYFEENHGTSVDEVDAPQSVIDRFYDDKTQTIIYAWEDDYYRRNPRD